VHPERRRRTHQLAQLADQNRWEEIYRRLALYEFGHEMRMGLQLAFLRTFCVPAMAHTLVQAGHIIDHPTKRLYDTGLIIYEIIANGLDSPDGRQMIRLMNRAHHYRHISDDQMTYTLSAFIVAPYQYLEWTGWRPLTDTDRQASAQFYARMGQLMNISHIPASYAEAAAFLHSYEIEYVTGSDDVRKLGRNLITALKHRLPGPAKPIATPLFTALMNDARIARALGYQPLPPPIQAKVRGLGHFYGLAQRQCAPTNTPVFSPGQKAGTIYPHGYNLDQLGPPQPAPSTPGCNDDPL
jgi:hypothetical protein